MKLLLAALFALGSLSALADGNNKISLVAIESGVDGRLEGYKKSTIVTENIKLIEAKYQVNCGEGNVDTGHMDNPLVNSNIYTTWCSGKQHLKVKIISKFKSLGDLPEGKTIAQFKLKKVKVKVTN